MFKNEKYFRYFNKIIIWTCFKIILFIIIDFTISSLLNFSSQKIYDIKSNGFYKFNKNVNSYEVIGNKNYTVLTDEYGYRTSKDKIDHKNFTKKYDVINTFDTFRNYSKSNENWYKEIYINGDIHFSKFGNEIMLNEVVQRINQ